MSRLTQSIARSIAEEAKITSRDTCNIFFTQTEHLGFIEHSFVEQLRRASAHVRVGSSLNSHSAYVHVQPSQADVVYEATFRSGLFGEKKAVRVISVGISAQVMTKPGGNVTFAGVRTEQSRDTVLVGSLGRLESPVIKVSQGKLPEGSLVDAVVEPFVVLAAAGVIIYLFFTVRS